MAAYDLEALRGLSLARQFPAITGRDADAVVEAVGRIGPVQSQTARSPFVGLGARLPGVTHAAVTEAYESWRIVRGSTLRGTVHTSTAGHHALLGTSGAETLNGTAEADLGNGLGGNDTLQGANGGATSH